MAEFRIETLYDIRYLPGGVSYEELGYEYYVDGILVPHYEFVSHPDYKKYYKLVSKPKVKDYPSYWNF